MIKKSLRFSSTLLITFMVINNCFAQENVNVKVSRNENIVDISAEKSYVLLYNEPLDGRITFSDKTYAKAKLNLNLLTDEVLFITPENELLPVANQDQISFFSIGKDLFFKTSNGTVQVVANINDIQLGMVRGFKTVNIDKGGAYGMSSSTSSVQQASSLLETGNRIIASSLTVNQKVELGYYEKWYLINKSKFYPATLKNFSKIFKIDKKELETYVKTANIDINKKEDLISLMNYCTAR
ncbi:MAG: hypothetical protein WHS63_12840 [Tenuifilum sp.]|uniref:hypothetical protein n=1 Tax=Tenuifilum sp. TaxID=2760880 RepID=UPI00309C4604